MLVFVIEPLTMHPFPHGVCRFFFLMATSPSIWCSLRFFRILQRKAFVYFTPVRFCRLRPPSVSYYIDRFDTSV